MFFLLHRNKLMFGQVLKSLLLAVESPNCSTMCIFQKSSTKLNFRVHLLTVQLFTLAAECLTSSVALMQSEPLYVPVKFQDVPAEHSNCLLADCESCECSTAADSVLKNTV